jgi:hypothetical protein
MYESKNMREVERNRKDEKGYKQLEKKIKLTGINC